MKKIFIILKAAMVAAGSVSAADNKKASNAKSNTKTTAKAAPKSDKEYTHSVGVVAGSGAAAGIEAKMKNAPIAFSFDFRPGYGCLLGNDGTGNIGAFHVFDWTLNLGARYTF